MRLEELWAKYSSYNQFNYSILPEELKEKGSIVSYRPNEVIINQGDFPRYIFFIMEGLAFGTRNYHDGNNYRYFTLTPSTGSIGLLEVAARKPGAVATVIAATEMKMLKLDSAIAYEYLMTHMEMLWNCIYIVANDLYQRSGNDGFLYYKKGLDRVRYYLVQYYLLHHLEEDILVVEPDYQVLASNIGLSVRTVVRCVQKLKQLDEITSCRRKLTISPEQHERSMSRIQPLLPS